MNHQENQQQIQRLTQAEDDRIAAADQFFHSLSQEEQQDPQQQLLQEQMLKEKADLDKYRQAEPAQQLKMKSDIWLDEFTMTFDKMIGAERSDALPYIVAQLTVAEYQQLMAKAITPDQPLTAVIPETIMGDYSKQDWAMYHQWNGERKQDQGWLSFYRFFKSQLSYLFLTIILLLFGGGMALERTAKQDHRAFLRLQGYDLRRIFLAKLAIALLTASTLILCGVAGVLVTSAIFGNTGSLAYPILSYYFPSEFAPLAYRWLPLSAYLLKAFLLLLVCCVFLVAVCLTAGRFLKSELVCWLVGALVLGLGFILPVNQWNPLYYFNIHQVVSGLGNYEANRSFSWGFGFVYLLSWVLVIIAANTLTLARLKNFKKAGGLHLEKNRDHS